MDNELAIKIATLTVTGIGSSAATWKILSELLGNQRERLREEYKFAKEFLSETKNGSIHPYLIQLGYQTIAGNAKADFEEIAYLLTLKQPRTAINDYSLGRSYLQFFSTSLPPGFVFNQKHKSGAKRKLFKIWFLVSYFITYSIAVSPLIMMLLKLLSPGFGISLFALSSIMFFPFSFISLKASTKLDRAEALIKLQENSRKAVNIAKHAA